MNMIVENFMQMHFNIFKCGPACPYNICVECGSFKLTQISEYIRQGLITVCPRGGNPVLALNCFFKYQPIASEISSQPSRHIRAETNLLADEKFPHIWNQVVVWVTHLYLCIFFRYIMSTIGQTNDQDQSIFTYFQYTKLNADLC